ncbi:hypothetical protein ADUPG1_013727 [Aduncisulcus paluster]|uniref:Uncharacterized protein n=1 Tax=Aduncisulcus paluster TaxID=2918883 RepID=A0ABQ5K3Y4_9EUKA|nr:hypothetical protein ADUPG1_013727 [Aduncisulcus paluster]
MTSTLDELKKCLLLAIENGYIDLSISKYIEESSFPGFIRVPKVGKDVTGYYLVCPSFYHSMNTIVQKDLRETGFSCVLPYFLCFDSMSIDEKLSFYEDPNSFFDSHKISGYLSMLSADVTDFPLIFSQSIAKGILNGIGDQSSKKKKMSKRATLSRPTDYCISGSSIISPSRLRRYLDDCVEEPSIFHTYIINREKELRSSQAQRGESLVKVILSAPLLKKHLVHVTRKAATDYFTILFLDSISGSDRNKFYSHQTPLSVSIAQIQHVDILDEYSTSLSKFTFQLVKKLDDEEKDMKAAARFSDASSFESLIISKLQEVRSSVKTILTDIIGINPFIVYMEKYFGDKSKSIVEARGKEGDIDSMIKLCISFGNVLTQVSHRSIIPSMLLSLCCSASFSSPLDSIVAKLTPKALQFSTESVVSLQKDPRNICDYWLFMNKDVNPTSIFSPTTPPTPVSPPPANEEEDDEETSRSSAKSASNIHLLTPFLQSSLFSLKDNAKYPTIQEFISCLCSFYESIVDLLEILISVGDNPAASDIFTSSEKHLFLAKILSKLLHSLASCISLFKSTCSIPNVSIRASDLLPSSKLLSRETLLYKRNIKRNIKTLLAPTTDSGENMSSIHALGMSMIECDLFSRRGLIIGGDLPCFIEEDAIKEYALNVCSYIAEERSKTDIQDAIKGLFEVEKEKIFGIIDKL